MPKAQRTAKEIEAAKAEILQATVKLIVDIGYDDFSMRKLARTLGMTATTIYNYYKNKDDLYLHLLIRGFDTLNARLAEARRQQATPELQLSAMIRAYTDFGLDQANFYNLMYSWHVPKYNDYVGTPMQQVADLQLEAAMKVPAAFFETIRAYAKERGRAIGEADAWFLLIHYWSQLHGFVAGCNNTILSYIHPVPFRSKTGIWNHLRPTLSQMFRNSRTNREKPHER